MQQLSNDNAQDTALSCLLIPMQASRLVLPNVTVAELIPFQRPTPNDEVVSWLMGTIEWRGIDVPVINYEEYCGQKAGTQGQDQRIAIINAPHGEAGKLRFFGIVTQGLPSLVKLEESAIKENQTAVLEMGQKMAVTLETGHGIIPDIDALEAAITEQPWQ